MLEKSFIIFRLRAFSRNLRKEIAKSFKVYFYDLGIRNTLIQNYNALSQRPDLGALWENFCIIERMKTLHYHRKHVNRYFWRTYDQQEIDYIEESGGVLAGYEFKWNKKTTVPKSFVETYPNSTFQVITPDSFEKFVREESVG